MPLVLELLPTMQPGQLIYSGVRRATREAAGAGITPFCITVDKAGHDYLREMCDGARYMVIEDIAALPRELPKIYQRVVTV